MSVKPRDPVTDPQPGDVITTERRMYFEVTKREGRNVKLKVNGERPEWWGLDEWSLFAKGKTFTAIAKPKKTKLAPSTLRGPAAIRRSLR